MNPASPPDEPGTVPRAAFDRERAARRRSEQLLEERARELFVANESLRAHVDSLAQRAFELELLHDLTAYTHENVTRTQALQAFVYFVCTKSLWPTGHVYLVESDDDGEPRLRSSGLWHFLDPEPWAAFRKVTEGTVFRRGEGLPGRVLARAAAAWIPSARDDANFPRAALCPELALGSAFAVPIALFGEVVAVAEFFTSARSEPDAALLRTVETASMHLGTALERRARTKELELRVDELRRVNLTLRSTQAQLVESEKFASLGVMAAGIAHEINNPVAFVTSNAETLRSYLHQLRGAAPDLRRLLEVALASTDADVADAARAARAACEDHEIDYLLEDSGALLTESLIGLRRVRDVVTNLRRFARSDDGALAATDLNGTLESVIKITANELAAECDVRRDFAELPPVRCHPAQIQQALIQVLVNAFQAVADGGTVSVRTRVVDDHVEIAISDDGPGIDPDHLDKLFTPFFTTRPVGQGSGLGLSSAYGIVRRHGGEIRVMSEPGKGATFVVRLPVAEPSEETPLSSSAA